MISRISLSIFLFYLSFGDVFADSLSRPVNKFWAVTCRNFDCDAAFVFCADNRCNGIDQCQRCVTNDYPRCATCVQEIFDERERFGENLLCDPEDKLQVDGCRFFCRGFFYPYGECLYENGIPLCVCSRSSQSPTTTSVQPKTTPTTTRLSQTSTATRSSNLEYGLREDVPIQDLLSQSYLVGYNVTYSTPTSSADINQIRKYCLQDSVFCAAGGRTGSNTLSLIACGNCLAVTDNTVLNRPRFNTAAYWYNTPKVSFGFSPNSIIDQDDADLNDLNDRLRLSWHLDTISFGGWRLGNLTGLNNNEEYRKYVFYRL